MYYRFEPNPLPLGFNLTATLGNQLLNTSHVLGQLDGLTSKLSEEEISLLRLPFIMKEAQLSSEIEGTRSTLSDVYKGEKQKETDAQKALDNEEIQNYAEALGYGLTIAMEKGITEELIKRMHEILLRGVRGSDKQPGEYKIHQNAIGSRQDTMESAKFVPASPGTTPSLMENLIEFLNNDRTSNVLFKTAVSHYQFEVIHPFRDGNGRLGRLLIMLMLYKDGILSQPLLYISEYFNRNRSAYTESLYDVSSKNKVEEWVMFFLKALEVQAKSSLKLIRDLEYYKREMKDVMCKVSSSIKMDQLINLLFKNPFITITDVANALGMTVPGASNLVHKLESRDILKEITGKKKRKIFLAHIILDILEGRQVMRNHSKTESSASK